MFRYLLLTIPSPFILSNRRWILAAVLSFALVLPAVSSTPLKLANFELSGVVMNNSDSIAVLFDKEESKELILRVGDVVSGCVLDYIRRNRVSFYCNDQIQTLTLRSLSVDKTSAISQIVWSEPVTVPDKEQAELFDKPENFITTFNLVPFVQDGRLAAFQVKTAPKEDISSIIDLQEGDLIVAINGGGD